MKGHCHRQVEILPLSPRLAPTAVSSGFIRETGAKSWPRRLQKLQPHAANGSAELKSTD